MNDDFEVHDEGSQNGTFVNGSFVEHRVLQKGDLVVCVAFGAGLAWAATAIEWSLPLPVPKPPRWRIFWRRMLYHLARIQSWWRRIRRRAGAWLRRLREGEDE